jgi:hypothetical protein
LGKKLNGNYQDEMGNRYKVRIERTRVRHSMGMTSIFKHYREVEQRNGEAVMKFAPMKKTIYSLGALREALGAANHRFTRRRGRIAASTFSTGMTERSS